ncbi:MAG: poly-beta-1,6-N-acetyl-D-glucosamine biosynthesis protein PgaD [Methylomonas sp.]|jgi:biofilm PGA synthesis protein PgaD|uniref:poly-beta-1,6-N-acetyl-D-glucosamine biosynthesis protein PgaD n=1 Tax=Methylomonas sp. TaxID=418 RepID=UPI0025E23D17|nr:poly-beta-1,6-N-acetyl-D-glucosamine biosynthesis protein PgaD [Methylomonas sp.]MCK9607286.1 poly-beta-1,6-N-acetyl-D-glucosamine biosynthesis protein PgaD [Methylomonas sp.]
MNKPLVIDSPSLQSLRQRYLSATFTFVFWVIWILLWTPLITLIGWLFGLDLVYIEMIKLEGYKGVIADFGLFLICITVIGSILGIWAAYNFYRFKDLERRAAIEPVNNRQLAAFFKIELQTLTKQQKAQCLSVSFDNQGHIIVSRQIDPAIQPADDLQHSTP